jgi:hypothetical protein
MNYFLLIVVLALCGGLYLEQQKATSEEKRAADQTTQIASLLEENKKLKDENDRLSSSQAAAKTAPAPSQPAPAPAPGAPVKPVTNPAPAVAKLTSDQIAQSIVVIKGDSATGTGFLVKTAEGPAVMTNLRVLANNPNLKITTITGTPITATGMKGAIDRDLATLPIADGPYAYLTLVTDFNTVHVGDDLITPGNTAGKLDTIGPDRIEFDNPVSHASSGGPVVDSTTGTVIGVVTEAPKAIVSTDLDKTSFQSRDATVASTAHYFGLRFDTAPTWEAYDPARYQSETALLDQFHQQSRDLDSYLNSGPGSEDGSSSSSSLPYQNDAKIMEAHRNYHKQSNSLDTAALQISELRQLTFDLDAIASKDEQTLENPTSFYGYDQQRARDELAYRKALQTEIQDMNNDVKWVERLPKSNN